MTVVNAIPYDGRIAEFIREKIRAGVSKTQVFHGIQKFQNAPRSLTTFYKLYREDMDEVLADIVGQIGSKVVKQALDGDYKSQELFLRSKGGWSPQSTENVVETDATEVDESALDKLMKLLVKTNGE